MSLEFLSGVQLSKQKVRTPSSKQVALSSPALYQAQAPEGGKTLPHCCLLQAPASRSHPAVFSVP